MRKDDIRGWCPHSLLLVWVAYRVYYLFTPAHLTPIILLAHAGMYNYNTPTNTTPLWWTVSWKGQTCMFKEHRAKKCGNRKARGGAAFRLPEESKMKVGKKSIDCNALAFRTRISGVFWLLLFYALFLCFGPRGEASIGGQLLCISQPPCARIPPLLPSLGLQTSDLVLDVTTGYDAR